MRKLFATLALVVGMGAVPALAADVVVPLKTPKARLSALFEGYSGSGLYFGLYTQGGGGTVNGSVAGVGSASLTSAGASVGLLGGYAWTTSSGNIFYAVEALFGWQNLNGSTAGLSMSGPASFEQRFKIGAPLDTIMSVFPNLNLGTLAPLPALPAGVTTTATHPYVMAGVHEDDISANYGLGNNKAWRVAPAIGFGAVTQLSNATAVDVWVETIFPEKGVCTGGVACANLGQQYKAGLSVLW
jgi:hypothetical protein